MPDLPDHEERHIRQYVEGQIRDDDTPVTLVQKVESRRLWGQVHDIYDVHTTEDRWWVITAMTNLYSQAEFPKLDTAFTFHLGLMMQLQERDRVEIDEDSAREVLGAWRRYRAAVDAMNDAREAEDYQAVGVKCREALIAFGVQHQAAEWLPDQAAPPKRADFKGCTDRYAQALATGRFRRYLKEIAAKAWDLAVGLQHDANATAWDAEITLDAIGHVLDVYSIAIRKTKMDPPSRCPACESYRFVTDGDLAEREGKSGWLSSEVCSACGHRGPETFRSWHEMDRALEDAARGRDAPPE
ncbi:hypothetical protein [Promicromonospora aerolata]|uniref:Uncharacterized protein n=1 Tax=Promicromonospora aerolata TaxID=195749 RepID=A0ABW4VA95_9MICO